MQGGTQTIFDPYSDVTRAQVITMVVRAGRAVKPEALPDPPPEFSSVLGQFDNVHAPNLRIAEYHGPLGVCRATVRHGTRGPRPRAEKSVSLSPT